MKLWLECQHVEALICISFPLFDLIAFSIAKYRLDKLGSKSADFFDPSSSFNYQQRNSLLASALEDSIRYLNRGGEIAIIDGTNTTKDRRQMIRDRVALEDGYDILWIESINDNLTNGKK